MPETGERKRDVHLRDAGAVAAHFRDLGLLEREVLAIAGLDHRGRLLCERRLQGHAFGVAATPGALLPAVLAASAVGPSMPSALTPSERLIASTRRR